MTPQKGEDSEQDQHKSAEGKAPVPNSSGFPFLNRSRMMGSSGLQAASIGWVLAGCVFLGYFAGAWLDNHFKTQFWMPVLVLLGVVAGFREMFITLAQLQRSQQEEKARAKRDAASARQIAARAPSSTDQSKTGKSNPVVEAEVSESGPKRLFSVPAPPISSFDVRPAPNSENSRLARDAAIERQSRLDAEEILRVLKENPEELEQLEELPDTKDEKQSHEP